MKNSLVEISLTRSMKYTLYSYIIWFLSLGIVVVSFL